MKKILAAFVVVLALGACSSLKNMGMSEAATLLSTLTPNSSVGQIASLFTLLDTNADKAISTTEAIGSVADNFGILDKNNSSTLNLTELEGLLPLLK